MSVYLEPPVPDEYGSGSITREVTDEHGRFLGELVWSPTETQPTAEWDVAHLGQGWNVFADCSRSGRLARNLHKTRHRGIRTLQMAIRVLLVQLDVNDRERVDEPRRSPE